MKVVTASEMREIDRETIQKIGILGLILMERAGLAVVSRIRELYGKRKIIVICGTGNNGGDGLVVARNLHNEGWNVTVFLVSGPENFKGDALTQYRIALNVGVNIHSIRKLFMKPSSVLRQHSVIVDAILGTGLKKNISGEMAEVIKIINSSGLPVVSVDIPSGISTDNGQILGIAVKADSTVTFGLPKRGHFLFPGAEFSGKLFIENIGFPQEMLQSEKIPVELLDKNFVSALFPARKKYSHKGTYGHVLVVSGSTGKTGAALMTARACLRSGAGLVTLGIPESLAEVIQSHVVEEMTLLLPDKGDGTLSGKASRRILDFLDEKADVLAIGPGIGVSPQTIHLMQKLVRDSEKPLVIDADGINSLARGRDVLEKAKVPIILTPHPGEMSRLLNNPQYTVQEIESDRIETALSFARKKKIYLVLKGVPTILATPDGMVFVNSTGNPGMASAGTGDVLTGMISGFLGQTRDPLSSMILGVNIHGLAGDMAAAEQGQHSMIASDIIQKIPGALRSLQIHE
jgi:NAD(P)H-hydrate epimerase